MTTHYADFTAGISTNAEAYPISYSGSNLFDLSPLGQDLIELLPSYYYYGENNRKIMELFAVALLKKQESATDVTDQLFVKTATWGLKYWEQLVGLPVGSDSADYNERRASILAKLRSCSSKKCFVEGLEEIAGGRVIVVDLDPVVNPYQINIEIATNNITYSGPTSAPVATVSGSGALLGDYTYKVSYEFVPIHLPNYITLYPYGSSISGLSSGSSEPQRQYIRVTSGTGDFYLNIEGFASSIGPFTHLSTGEDIANGINTALEEVLGSDAVAALDPTAVVNAGGILLAVSGTYSMGLNLPTFVPTVSLPSTIVAVAEVLNGAQVSQVQITGETSSGTSPVVTNEKQKIVKSGTISGGTFTIKVNTVIDPSELPVFEETAPLSYTASPDQIRDALLALPSVYANTLLVSGGPLPNNDVVIEFIGSESGYPQNLLMTSSSHLVGGGHFAVERVTAGTTTYVDSTSNTVTATNQMVKLTDVPRSPDGALRRNIYRRKNGAYDQWVYVGTIDDNYSTVFIDNTPDSSLNEKQRIKVIGSGTFQLRFDGKVTSSTPFTAASTGADIAAGLQGLAPTTTYASLVISGSSGTVSDGEGITVTFGGDASGKDVPQIEIVENTGVAGYVIDASTIKPLSERNTAFTYAFQRMLNYIYVTKPAHIRVRELRGARSTAFRASINSAGDAV